MSDTTLVAGVIKLYADSALFFALMMQSYTVLMLALIAQTVTFWLKGYFHVPVVTSENYIPIEKFVKAPRVLSR